VRREALQIEEKIGRVEAIANQYGNIMYSRGNLDGAELMYREALRRRMRIF
jgi:hypothetical protein